jgi:hypothetical protein
LATSLKRRSRPVLIRAWPTLSAPSEEEKGFFEALNKLGIETKVKDIRIFAGGAKKADWDMGMASTPSPWRKSSTLLFGDRRRRLCPACRVPRTPRLPGGGYRLWQISSGQLREAADDFIDMCDNPRNYLIGYRGGSSLWRSSFRIHSWQQ